MSNKLPYGLYVKAVKRFVIPVHRREWILGLPYGTIRPSKAGHLQFRSSRSRCAIGGCGVESMGMESIYPPPDFAWKCPLSHCSTCGIRARCSLRGICAADCER